MLDLVNENYQDFLSLGSNLQGGDEKVEEVRLGLLGFRREIEGLKTKVDERRKEVDTLVGQRRQIKRQIQLGRTLLDVDYRLSGLEQSLMITSNREPQNRTVDGADDEMSESDDESDDAQEGDASISRLDRHVGQYMLTKMGMDRVGPDHPSIVQQEARMTRVKNTILLDLGNALKQSSGRDDGQMTKLLAAYRDLGESQEALKVLKERKL